METWAGDQGSIGFYICELFDSVTGDIPNAIDDHTHELDTRGCKIRFIRETMDETFTYWGEQVPFVEVVVEVILTDGTTRTGRFRPCHDYSAPEDSRKVWDRGYFRKTLAACLVGIPSDHALILSLPRRTRDLIEESKGLMPSGV